MNKEMFILLVWEIVSRKVEQTFNAEEELLHIGYIDFNLLSGITEGKIIASDECILTNITKVDGKIFIEYSFDISMNLYNSNNEYIFNMFSVVEGSCKFPDEKEYDYSYLSEHYDEMNKSELLSYENIISEVKINYSNIDVNT